MKMSVQIELERAEGDHLTKEQITEALEKKLCLSVLWVNRITGYNIYSVRLITGARPIVKEPDAITPH
jgi:hypothetical protein